MTLRGPASAVIVSVVLLAGHAGSAGATEPGTGDPVVAAVGDMACAPEDSHFNGGLGTSANCGELRTGERMAQDPTIDMLVGLGDYQYGCGDPAEYAVSYTPAWGMFNGIADPSAGNHEYSTTRNSANGGPCPDANAAAQDYFAYFGAAAHPATAGEYSFNLGAWHLISLNGNCSKTKVGGCGASSAQTRWLAGDLTANTQPCVLAYWHQPRFTATATNNSAYTPWWDLLAQHHADVVLNGHIHTYARFPLLDPSGHVDTTGGIREVIVGTGGESLVKASSKANPSPLVNLRTFGYLRMVLRSSGYDAEFIDSSGAVRDSFSGTCHGSASESAKLTVSQTAAGSVEADSPIDYTVRVTNPGTAPQTGVTLTDSPPATAGSVSASPSQGTCSGSGTIVCRLDTLGAGASATIRVTATPILPPKAANAATAQSDQAGQMTSSRAVTVTSAPATSYVAVTGAGFGTPAPLPALGDTVQWSFVGPGSHSATDSTSGLGLFPDTGLVAPVAFRPIEVAAAGAYTFTDAATGHTIKLNVPMTARPATGSQTTVFTLTWAAAPPPAGYAEDVQVQSPGTTSWVRLFKATTATSAPFTPGKGRGAYKFRARFRRIGATGASKFTGNATIRVS